MIDNNLKKGIRLNRYIAMCGLCSRRKAESFIRGGDVSINKKIITNLATRVFLKDIVFVNGKKITLEKKRYIVLNKPTGYITTMSDEKGRKTVVSLIKNSYKERVVPVGRLDKDTTGVLLFTNDGNLTKRLSHPSYEVQKIYHVVLDRAVTKKDFSLIKQGINLVDGLVFVDDIQYLDSTNKIRIQIHLGKNRIVRRIFEYYNYHVVTLDRIQYANIQKRSLPVGHWRDITKIELEKLNQ